MTNLHVDLELPLGQNPSPVTVIEIKPWRNGWKVFESVGVEPVFLTKDQATSYATGRASFRAGEIHLLSSNGELEETIRFNDADRAM